MDKFRRRRRHGQRDYPGDVRHCGSSTGNLVEV